MVKIKLSRASIRFAVLEAKGRVLDAIYAPVLSRLTHDEYFSCRTRNQCLAAYVRRRISEIRG